MSKMSFIIFLLIKNCVKLGFHNKRILKICTSVYHIMCEMLEVE